MKRNCRFEPAKPLAIRIPADLCAVLSAESLAHPDKHHGLIVVQHLRRSVEASRAEGLITGADARRISRALPKATRRRG